MKLQLPTVTLMIVDGINPQQAAKVLEICKSKIDFGAVKLLTHLPIDNKHRVEIMPLNSLVAYSVWCLTEMYKHIYTEHVLIVQRDGFCLNAESFNHEWLTLDFIAPLFVQYDNVGSGGFSLRSKRIMEHAARIHPQWNGTESHANELQKDLGYYEDGILCLSGKFRNYNFATKEQACNFGMGGNRNPLYFRSQPFGFHRTFHSIDFNTGTVDISSDNLHLKNSYDEEIEMLYKKLEL